MATDNTQDLFLDALSLLIVNDKTSHVDLISKLIDSYKEDALKNPAIDTPITRKFITMLSSLLKLPKDEEHDLIRTTTVTSFINTGVKEAVDDEDKAFYEQVKNIYQDARKIDGEKCPDIISRIERKITYKLTFDYIRKKTNRIWSKLQYFTTVSDVDDQENCLADIQNVSRNIADASDKVVDFCNGAEERVVFSDTASLKEAFEKSLEEDSVAILKTDLQGLNQALGRRHGFAMGEFAIIYGILHHFKTGMLLTILRGIAACNDPKPIVKPGKKPLLLLISLENYARKNLMWFWRTAYACVFKKKASDDLGIPKMIEMISKFYTDRGWEFIIERYQGRNFGFDEFAHTIERYEDKNYQIVACGVDYVEKMKKTSSLLESTGDGQKWSSIEDLMNGLYGYVKSHEFLFITPNQLNRDCMRIAEDSKVLNKVKHFGSSGAQGSVSVGQIADVELYVYIERVQKKYSYLTVQRGKHRYVEDTPISHWYFAYKFDPDIGIIGDVDDDRPKFTRDIYADIDDFESANGDNEQGTSKHGTIIDEASAPF